MLDTFWRKTGERACQLVIGFFREELHVQEVMLAREGREVNWEEAIGAWE